MPIYKSRNTHPEDVEFTRVTLIRDKECEFDRCYSWRGYTHFRAGSKISDKSKKILIERGIVLYLITKDEMESLGLKP